MVERSCDTCIHKEQESQDPNGNRVIDCDINEYQLFAPFAEECKHWEKGCDER